MLKFSRGKLIVFDIEEALSFEGETGPYLQYAVVRANNIFRKLQEREGCRRPTCSAALDRTPPDELLDQWPTSRRRTTSGRSCSRPSRLDEVVEQVVRSLEFSGLAKCTLRAGADLQRVLPSVSDPQRRAGGPEAAGARPASSYVRTQLTRALDLMGIDVPSRM